VESLLPMHPDLRRATVRTWAREAERLSLARVWTAELRSADPFVLAALLQADAPSVATGTSIASLYGRSVRSLAAAAATLGDGHDFILGIGVSNRAIAEWHDRAWETPGTVLPEAVGRIRDLLAGERDQSGPSLHWRRPEAGTPAIPVHLAGVSERGIELARSHADGLLLNLVPPGEQLERSVAAFRAGGDRPVRCVVRVTPHAEAPSGQWQAWVEKEIETYAAAPGYREVLADRDTPVPDSLVVRGADRWGVVRTAYEAAGVVPVVLPLLAPFEDPEEIVPATWAALQATV